MLDSLRIDAGPFVVVLLVLTSIVLGVLYALYRIFNRLVALLEKHDR